MSWEARVAYRAARKGNFECDNVRERGPVLSQLVGFSTVEALRAFCDVNNLECSYADEYGEPGYGRITEDYKGVLLCNWNHIPKKLANRLKAQGYELEWSDEWTIDYEARDDEGKPTSKAYRTKPDCHSWESSVRYTASGCEIFPDDDPQEWIDDALNDDDRPLPSWFDESELELRGFVAIDADDKEVGLHPGQDESPDRAGVPQLREQGFDVILQITDRGQFDVHYKIWTRREAEDTAAGAKFCEFEDTYYTHA